MENRDLQEIVKKVIDSVALSDINLEKARHIIKRVEEKASDMGVKAVVAVANAGANIVAVECMDESYIASYDIVLNENGELISYKIIDKDGKTLGTSTWKADYETTVSGATKGIDKTLHKYYEHSYVLQNNICR